MSSRLSPPGEHRAVLTECRTNDKRKRCSLCRLGRPRRFPFTRADTNGKNKSMFLNITLRTNSGSWSAPRGSSKFPPHGPGSLGTWSGKLAGAARLPPYPTAQNRPAASPKPEQIPRLSGGGEYGSLAKEFHSSYFILLQEDRNKLEESPSLPPWGMSPFPQHPHLLQRLHHHRTGSSCMQHRWAPAQGHPADPTLQQFKAVLKLSKQPEARAIKLPGSSGGGRPGVGSGCTQACRSLPSGHNSP